MNGDGSIRGRDTNGMVLFSGVHYERIAIEGMGVRGALGGANSHGIHLGHNESNQLALK